MAVTVLTETLRGIAGYCEQHRPRIIRGKPVMMSWFPLQAPPEYEDEDEQVVPFELWCEFMDITDMLAHKTTGEVIEDGSFQINCYYRPVEERNLYVLPELVDAMKNVFFNQYIQCANHWLLIKNASTSTIDNNSVLQQRVIIFDFNVNERN